MVRAQGRERVGYMEKHHVKPRCLGGGNDRSNLVLLTPKEHFLAHKLLVRIYPQERGVWYALILMGRLPGFKARIFASERARAAEARRGFRYSKLSKQKMSESAFARGRNSERTEFQPGQTPWNAGLSPEKSHRYGKKHSPQTLERMRTVQQALRNEQSVRMKQWWAQRKAAHMDQGVEA
jgi:hypothetical protein